MTHWDALRWADLVLTSLSCCGSLTLLWTYAWGNDWSSSRVGRALVSLAAAISFLTGTGSAHRAMGGGEVDSFTTTALAIVLAMILALDIAFIRERRDIRRRLTEIRNTRDGNPG